MAVKGKKVRLTGVNRIVRVKAASTANAAVATLDAGQVLDGVTLAANDRVLLKNQTTPAENGVWVINADGNAATRATDWKVGDDVVTYAVRVTSGTANANTVWAVYAEPAVVGTNDPQFIKHQRI